jgi:hypothetical protein
VSKIIAYFIVYLSCKSKNSARPLCYGTDSENRLDGIQKFGRFGSVFCKTVSDPSDGFPHTPSKIERQQSQPYRMNDKLVKATTVKEILASKLTAVKRMYKLRFGSDTRPMSM